jgi:hypothetical protein
VGCNSQMRQPKTVIIGFHNLTSFDGHLVIQAIADFCNENGSLLTKWRTWKRCVATVMSQGSRESGESDVGCAGIQQGGVQVDSLRAAVFH